MRALASDFDGTIFFEDGFRDEDLKQIQAYKKQGNMFGICTGRPLADLQRDMTKSLDLDFYICSTGALILDKEFNEIYKSVIERKLVEELVNKYIKTLGVYIQSDCGFMTMRNEVNNRVINDVINSLDDEKGEIYSVGLNAFNEENAKKICLELKEAYPDLEAYQNKGGIDIVPSGCSKGKGIQIIKNHFNIHHISGIGDSYNDIPLIRDSDCSFTFKSSPKEVIAHADYVVDSMSDAINILLKES